jgi:hypothetical protein
MTLRGVSSFRKGTTQKGLEMLHAGERRAMQSTMVVHAPLG